MEIADREDKKRVDGEKGDGGEADDDDIARILNCRSTQEEYLKVSDVDRIVDVSLASLSGFHVYLHSEAHTHT